MMSSELGILPGEILFFLDGGMGPQQSKAMSVAQKKVIVTWVWMERIKCMLYHTKMKPADI